MSTPRLFFGLFVNAGSLMIGARTFDKVKKPLLAIDLILLRQNKDTLVTNDKDGVVKEVNITLPEDVWCMIKKELIKMELVQSEKEIISMLTCRRCNGICGLHATTWKELMYPVMECFDCSEVQFLILLGDNLFRKSPPGAEIKHLVHFHSLKVMGYLPFKLRNRREEDSMVLIGIDNLKTKSIDSLEDLTVYESDVTSLPVPKFELTFSVEFISRQLNLLATNYAVEFGNPWLKPNKPEKFTKSILSLEEKEEERKWEEEEERWAIDICSNPNWIVGYEPKFDPHSFK